MYTPFCMATTTAASSIAAASTTDCYEAQLQTLAAIVMRQTNYTVDQAVDLLQKHHNDVHAVIREYMTGSALIANVVDNTVHSVNQQIYKEIRTMMDDAAKTYIERKKVEEEAHVQH